MSDSTPSLDGARILVTGGGGVLGHALAACAPEGARIVCVGRRPAAAWSGAEFRASDLQTPGELARCISSQRPDFVLLAAALSQVNACEEDPELARRVNVAATEEALVAAAEFGARVLLVSTTMVFGGHAASYDEHAAPDPSNEYGRTKLAAEQLALGAGAVVARLPLLLAPRASNGRAGFDTTLVEDLRAGKAWHLFQDEVTVPVAASLIAPPLWRLLLEGHAGVFHLAGSETVSRYELGQRICAAAGCPPAFEASLAAEMRDAHLRPRRLVLTCQRAEEALGWAAPDLRESLARWDTAHD